MIDTIYEGNETYYVPVCDRCGNTLEPEEEFSDAVQAKKDAGWRSFNVDGQWKNVCTDCLEKEAGKVDKAREILKKRRQKHG